MSLPIPSSMRKQNKEKKPKKPMMHHLFVIAEDKETHKESYVFLEGKKRVDVNDQLYELSKTTNIKLTGRLIKGREVEYTVKKSIVI